MKKKGLIGAIVTAIVMIAVVVGVTMCIEMETLNSVMRRYSDRIVV